MWTIKANGETLFATGVQSDSKRVLLSPMLREEINSAGSFSCIIPYTNELYDDMKLRTTTVEIYRDKKIYWRGRPMSVAIRYDRAMSITCEGALAFLNDTVYPPDACKLRLSLFLNKVIANHNEKCNANRQIHVGSITVDDVEIQYNGSFTQTMEVLRTLVDTYGGYIITHHSEGGSYFDWLKDIPVDVKETINIENVIDISKAISSEDIATCVIPVGKDGMTIGTEYIENEAASALFGRVWQCVEFNDIEDPDELYEAGRRYLNDNLWASMQLSVTAADLGSGYRVGRMYRAKIPTLNIDHNIALTSADTSLTDETNSNYTFTATTIWTQINNGKDLSQVVDVAQRLRLLSSQSLTSRTAKMSSFVSKATYYSGDIEFSNGTKITCVNGMITGGKTTEGDF